MSVNKKNSGIEYAISSTCIFIDHNIQLVILIQWACYRSPYPAAIDDDDWNSFANY